MSKPTPKELVMAVNTVLKRDDARLSNLLNEVQLKEVVEAESLLRGLAGTHVVEALLQWRRSGFGGLR